MRLFTTGSTMPGQAGWLDDPRSFAGWQKAEEAGLPVCLQMTAAGIPQLEDILRRFPALRVILDHLARPIQEDGPPYTAADSLWRLARFTGVYVKVTERNLVGARAGKATPETFFGRLIAEFGAPRITWGSNFPASERSLPELVALAQDTLGFLPEADREWIFSRTATNAVSSADESSMTLTTSSPVSLYSLLGNHPGTEALKTGRVSSPLVTFDFADVKVINTQFKAVVRELKYDFAELAIATYLQGHEYGKPYVLLPATIMGRASASHDLLQRGWRGTQTERSQRQTHRRPRLHGHDRHVGARDPGRGLWR
jgi:hypothetical protein